VQNVSAVTAACLVMRKAVFEAVGGLNENDLAIAYNDIDLCLRVREAGYLIVWKLEGAKGTGDNPPPLP